jgi:hypothetical protein
MEEEREERRVSGGLRRTVGKGESTDKRKIRLIGLPLESASGQIETTR